MPRRAPVVPRAADQPAEGPILSPAEFARALTDLHARPSLQSLCDATAHLGSAALGPTWVALLSRSASDEPLRPTAASGPDQARWPVEPPDIDADAVPDLFARIDEHGATADTVAAVCGSALPPETAAALQDALCPRIVGLAPVVVDGRRSGVVLVSVGADVPHEAVMALVEHAAAATRSLLHIDLLRAHGDRDHETGVLARPALERTVAREMVRARRYGRALTLVVARPNEHGVKALRALGQTMEEMIRETDFVARLDETYLAVLLPEVDHEGGQAFAGRVLKRVPGAHAGVANYPADGATWEALVSAATTNAQPLAVAPPAEPMPAEEPPLVEPSLMPPSPLEPSAEAPPVEATHAAAPVAAPPAQTRTTAGPRRTRATKVAPAGEASPIEQPTPEEPAPDEPAPGESSPSERPSDEPSFAMPEEEDAPPRPLPLPSRPTHVVGRIDDRFPQHAGPPPRLRDVFPNFSSRSAG